MNTIRMFEIIEESTLSELKQMVENKETILIKGEAELLYNGISIDHKYVKAVSFMTHSIDLTKAVIDVELMNGRHRTYEVVAV